MDRVSTLLKKLQKQFDEKSSAEAMLQTTQILQAELLQRKDKTSVLSTTRVSVLMPSVFYAERSGVSTKDSFVEEKVIQVLQVDEKEIEAELEEIKKNAEAANSRGSMNRPTFIYDPEDLPTLTHQDQPEKKLSPDELSFEYPVSLNDHLKEKTKIELSQSLTSTPIKDLKKGINVNDRFVFISELFRGDEAMYERSIKTIQSFSIYAEAEFWIKRELKIKIGWRDNHPVVKQFDQLVKRRFL